MWLLIKISLLIEAYKVSKCKRPRIDSSAFHTQAVTHNTWRRQQESHERVSQVILPLLVRSAACNLCWENLKTFWPHSQSQQHTWEGRWGWSFLKTRMTPAWRRGVRLALSHASFKRIHPCDWENHSQFCNLWCGGKGDQRHGILLCEKWGRVSPSIPSSGWSDYFLSLKAVCISDHRTDFLPISPYTHICNSISSTCNMLDPVTSATQFALPLPSLLGTQTCKLTSIQQELAVSNSSALTSFQALFSNPAEFIWIHLSS